MNIQMNGKTEVTSDGWMLFKPYFIRKMERIWHFVSAKNRNLASRSVVYEPMVSMSIKPMYVRLYTPESRVLLMTGIPVDFDTMVEYLWSVLELVWQDNYQIDEIDFRDDVHELEPWEEEFIRPVQYPELPPIKIDNWCTRSIHQKGE